MAKPLGIILPISLGYNGYFNNTTDATIQIKSNLTNLLLTKKGERVFRPDFGCNLNKIVFENITDDVLAQINAEIQTSVSAWMPFIRVDDVIVNEETDKDRNVIFVSVSYTILTTNVSDTIQLVF